MISPFRAAVVKIMKSLEHKLFPSLPPPRQMYCSLWYHKTGKRLISSFEIHHPPLNWTVHPPNNARQEPGAGWGRIRWEIIKSFPRNKKPPFCSETRSFYFPFLFALWSFLTGLWGHVDKRIATFSSSRGQSLIFYARGSRAGESIIYRGPRVKSFWLRPSHLPLSFLPAGKCTIVLKSIRRGRAPIKLGKHSNFKH